MSSYQYLRLREDFELLYATIPKPVSKTFGYDWTAFVAFKNPYEINKVGAIWRRSSFYNQVIYDSFTYDVYGEQAIDASCYSDTFIRGKPERESAPKP